MSSTKPRIAKRRSTHHVFARLRSASFSNHRSVERARSSLPRCASTNERQPKATACGNPRSMPSTSAASLRELVGEIPPSGAKLDHRSIREAITPHAVVDPDRATRRLRSRGRALAASKSSVPVNQRMGIGHIGPMLRLEPEPALEELATRFPSEQHFSPETVEERSSRNVLTHPSASIDAGTPSPCIGCRRRTRARPLARRTQERVLGRVGARNRPTSRTRRVGDRGRPRLRRATRPSVRARYRPRLRPIR